jgi:hypothetical protein
MRRLLAPLGALVVAAPLLAGCASDRERYCDAVQENQTELSEIAAQGGQESLIEALDIYRELQEKAPRDITDEWDQVVRTIEALDEALADAGVDPASYDPGRTPDGLADDDRRAIEAAARDLGRPETVEAMSGVEQQARDVCGTPLSQ